jgi:hypothetical protein
MLTAKQIAANRLNSQEAPGSRTVEGKAVSSFNALKHGAGHHARYSPVDPKKCFLLEASIELCHRHAGGDQAQQGGNTQPIRTLPNIRNRRGCNSARAFPTSSGAFQRLQTRCQLLIVRQALPPAKPDALLQVPQPQPTSSASFRQFCKPPAWTPQGLLCAASASLRLRVEEPRLRSPTPTIQTHLHILSFVPRINPANQPSKVTGCLNACQPEPPQNPLCAASPSSRLRVEEPRFWNQTLPAAESQM